MKKQVLFIVLMFMPLMASASTKINGIYYNLNSTTKVAEVTSVPSGTSKYTGSISIPKTVTYGGVTYSVTTIGSHAFYECSGLTSITIPNGVTSIEDWAFYSCSGLTSITLPNSVTSIGHSAFQFCYLSVTIPNNVTFIGDWAFEGCSFPSITIPNGVTSIGKGTFANCNLTSLTIPNSVTSIGDEAFYGCIKLTSVIIGSNVSSIGDSAFGDCSSLTSVTIPNSVTSIGRAAFLNCYDLTTITIPNSVTSIGSDAFAWCGGLSSIKVEDGNTIYDSRNNCNAIIKSSNNELIIGCKSTIIPSSVTSIGHAAFFSCYDLTTITIPNSVTSIGASAFSECQSLTSLTIPNSVTSIGNDAFQYCYSLTTVTVGMTTPIAISSNVFPNRENCILYVPQGCSSTYKDASYWREFQQILELEDVIPPMCEKPIITILANGKVKVECATEGATCVTNITASNAEPLSDGEISLNTPLTVYTVTSHATKEGYDDSEVATATFRYEKTEGDINGDGNLNISDVVQLVNMILGQ